MFNQNPTDQTKKDLQSSQLKSPLFGFGQTQPSTYQKKQTTQSPSNFSNLSQNIDKSKQNLIPKPKTQSPNQEQKQKQVKQMQNQTRSVNKQNTGGGVLRPGGKQDQKRDSLAIDTTLHFGLQDIIDSMVHQKKLDGRQLDKIVRNFKNYVKCDDKPFSLQKVSEEDTKIVTKPKILKLPYLNQIEDKSKITINQFWVSMLQSVCQKVPFLSEEACLEIMKLEISMNKGIYCQKGNFGNFQVQLFAKPHLFPIINNKMQVNTQHHFYISVQTQIIDLFLNLFKALHKIFREMSQLKIIMQPKYKKIFQSLQQNRQKKREVLKNLIESFFSILKHTRQQKFISSLPYLQCVADSIWYFYLVHKNIFEQDVCKGFLNKLNENYCFFNESGKNKSSNLKNVIDSVEKISISFLLSHPFDYQRWQDQSLKSIILESNLEMLQPFKMILPSNKRQERQRRIQNYETKGYHWKEFIEIMIKLDEDDEQTIAFIIECIKSFFSQNFELFWEEPIQFQNFYKFTTRLLTKKSKQFNEKEIMNVFLDILGTGSKLMGDQKQETSKNQVDFNEGEKYPQKRALPFSMRVHNQFSDYFLGMNKREFLEVIGSQLVRMIEDKKEKGTYEYEQERELNFKRQLLLKEYLLKLIYSEPSLFFFISKITSGIKQEQLLEFLILQTITDPFFPSNIIDAAFVTLDTMLMDVNTSKLIQNILSLDIGSSEPYWSANQIFSNIKALPFIARHCEILICLNYEQKRWTQQLLRKFYEFSVQEGRKLFNINSVFAKSYYQLLSSIFGALNSRGVANISSLRPYINISFIIDSLKYYLKFDFYRGDYVNIAVCEQNPQKIESLLECLRLYNIILINQLQLQSTNLQDNLKSNIKKTNNYLPEDSNFLSAFEAKKLGISDNEFQFQVKSVKNETTSYLNSLSFILVSSAREQKMILKQINYDYESLIFQTIQNLAKLNGKTKLKSHFQVTNPRMSSIGEISKRQIESGWCLKKFVSYIQNSLNQSGIQIIVFGDLIQKPQRLRSLIDNVRVKIQNPKIRDRMSTKLTLKLISTLTRYFRDSMARMALNKDKETNFTSLQIRDHFEYLLQTVVEIIVAMRVDNHNWQQTMMRNILSNIYAGILTVQNFNGLQFLKLLKNFHPLLLNSMNLSYLFNMIDVNLSNSRELYETEQNLQIVFDENYFKLLQLFFNCEQYLTQQQFKIIKGIKQLPERLQYFIDSIVKYTQFSKLPQDFTNILLQILATGVSFYISVCNTQKQKNMLLSTIRDFINDLKYRIQPSVNLVLLELLSSDQVFSSQNLIWQNQQILPLQIISIDQKLPFKTLEQIVSKLRKPNLNNMAFLSIATGLFSYIQRSEDQLQNPAFLLNPLLEVYNQLLRIPQSYVKQFSNLSLSSPQSTQIWNGNNWNSPYKNIWTLQLILVILTNIQARPSFQKSHKQKQFQNLLIQNDGILKRFGLIMKKIGIQESQTYLPWLPFLEQQIQFQLQNKSQVSFVQKIELYQILKIFSFLFANTDWQSSFVNKHVDLVSILVQYRKVFEKLCFSGKKHKGQTTQEKILESISLGSLLSSHDMLASEVNRLERQKAGGDVLKSSNSFELLHQVINFQLSVQYSLMCSSVGIQFCHGLSRKLPELADLSKWNTLFLELAQSLVQKYIQVINQQPLLNKILSHFSSIYNGNSQYNIALSKQMLFTNSSSLSCCLDVSSKSWKQVLIETLSLLFESIYTINRKLQTQLHSDFKNHQQKFNFIISLLKKHDNQNFDYALYVPTEQKNKLSNTIRSNISRNPFNSMIHPFSETIRNY